MSNKEYTDFLLAWQEDPLNAKNLFMALHDCVREMGAGVACKYRPGVSFSLRAANPQSSRELVVLVDVIDDDPAARWLSVCVVADLVEDPEERGDVVPGGLMQMDARCFDVDDPDASLQSYLCERLREAFAAAAEK